MKNEYMNEFEFEEYNITLFSTRIEEFPLKDYNLDVSMELNNKQYYFTFFTITNIQALFDKFKINGECKNGLYFNCRDMVILEEVSIENIKNTIDAMIEDFSIENFTYK